MFKVNNKDTGKCRLGHSKKLQVSVITMKVLHEKFRRVYKIILEGLVNKKKEDWDSSQQMCWIHS